jgi:hypothetical protein
MDLKEKASKDVDFTHLVRDRVQGRVHVEAVMNIFTPQNDEKFLECLSDW